MTETINIIISAVAGIIAGGIASLIAPWVHWGIEKKKILFNNKINLIRACKTEINKKTFDNKKFVESSLYADKREHLTNKLKNMMEHADNKVIIQMGGRGGGANNFKPQLLDEIKLIEKNWGIK